MKFFASSVMVALAAATSASATVVFVKNMCDYPVELWDNHAGVPLAPGASHDYPLPDGFHGMLRNGRDPQATLGEFTIAGGKAWFDISIIPTAPGRGPDYCPSLDACKAHTGGVGYNTPMEILPHSGINGAHCRVLTCMNDGCADAYQYPKDDTKTHNCPGGTDFDLTFCPGGTGGATPPPTPAPTPEPTTPAPTNATEDRSMDALLESGLMDSSKSGSGSGSVEIQTPLPTPTTEAPTPAPTPAPTEAPVVEANTQSTAGESNSVGIVFLALGAVAAAAGAAMIVVIRRKKAALDAMEDKHSIALHTSTAGQMSAL